MKQGYYEDRLAEVADHLRRLDRHLSSKVMVGVLFTLLIAKLANLAFMAVMAADRVAR